MDQPKTSKASVIKSIYFYLVSFVALMMVVFSTADMINMVLKTYIFTKANQPYYYKPLECQIGTASSEVAIDDTSAPKTTIKYTPEECTRLEEENMKQQRESMIADNQRNAVRDISMIVVGIPLFIFHWGFIRKRKDEI